MSSEDPSHDDRTRAVPFRDAESARRLRKSLRPDQEFFDILLLPLREDKTMSDDAWRQQSVDNILSLLKANAQLRALAIKLSDILAARGGWDRDSLEKAARVAAPRVPRARSKD